MNLINRIKRRIFGVSGNQLIEDLRKGGAIIGEKVVLFDASSILIDKTRPWLLRIGDYTKITRGCVILTHDYSLSVLRRVYGEWIGEGGETVIGCNCFLGMNSIVLMGTKIGDNVIVGAGSVVHGVIPSNVVVAGNPAKVICTLEEYHEKRSIRTKDEAVECAKKYYERFGVMPPPEVMSGFKFILFERDKEFISNNHISFKCNGDEPKEVEKSFYSSMPYWDCYDSFVNEVKKEISKC